MENIEFLKILYGNVPGGYVGISYIINGKIKTKWFAVSELEDMLSFIDETGKEYNTYYGVNPRREKLPYYVRGSDKDIGYVIGVQMDFDVKGEAHKQDALPGTKERLLSYIDTIPMKPSLLIWSGNGIHALWLFEAPYEMEEDTSYINRILKGWEAHVNAAARNKNGWIFDSVADTARMLRAPGTINHKTEDKPVCEVILYSDERYKPGNFERFMDANVTASNATSTVDFDADDFACMGVGDATELIARCEFLQHCKNDAVNLSEQHWFGAISNLACCSNGREVIHEISEPYPKYTYEECVKMSSRGARIKNGHITTDEYMLKDDKMVEDAKVLVGSTSKQHGLPDYAHSPNSKYIKENPDGSFRELRDYNASGFPIIEIGYHPEQTLTGNRYTYVLHYHTFESDLRRVMGGEVSETQNADIYAKYRKYLRRYGL